MTGTVGITACFYDNITCLMMMMIHMIQDMHRSENWAYTVLLLCFQHDTARFCFFYRTHMSVFVRRLQTEGACPMFPNHCQQSHLDERTQMR